MRTVICFGAALAAAAVLAASCSRGAAGTAGFAADSVTEESVAFVQSAPAAKLAVRSVAAPAAAADAGLFAASGDLPSGQERKLVYTGSLEFTVKSLADFSAAVEEWVQAHGGYISSSAETTTGVSVTAHVPQARFHEAMAATASLGTAETKNISSRDVSEQFYDLETRLSTRRTLLERLETYLARASDMEDLLRIESEINDVTAELESMQGQMNRLEGQIEYARIDIFGRLPSHTTESGFRFPRMSEKFSGFLAGAVEFFADMFIVLLYAAVCGIPAVLVLAGIYWLAWGRAGLLRRLLKKVSRRPDENRDSASSRPE